MRHCARGRSDASPADRGGMASLGPALARLNAGRACPALLHATPKSGCRLNADHGALGSGRAGRGTLGCRFEWHRPLGPIGCRNHEIAVCTVHGDGHLLHGSVFVLKGHYQRHHTGAVMQPGD
jgi:hypothetical protein